jgi:hypothetical protein
MRINTDAELITTCLANVRPESIRWLWPDVIPRAKLTVIAGDPGLGKSFLTLDLAARVSRGAPMPGETRIPAPSPFQGEGRGEGSSSTNPLTRAHVVRLPSPLGGEGAETEAPRACGRPPAHVVLLTAEDGIADTIRPRLDAHGADVSRIHAVRGVRTGGAGGGEIGFSLSRDLELVKQAVRELEECALVVIDPITAYMDKADANSNAEVRSVLDPLARFAEELDVAVVVVTHLNKSGAGSSSKAVHRICGSIAFTAAARAVWGITKDRTDPERRLMLPVKMNIAKDVGGMAYRIKDGRLEWEPDAIDLTADDQMSSAQEDARNHGPSALDEAKQFLREELRDGPVGAQQVKQNADDLMISPQTLRVAREAIGVASTRRTGDGRTWDWALPHEQ